MLRRIVPLLTAIVMVTGCSRDKPGEPAATSQLTTPPTVGAPSTAAPPAVAPPSVIPPADSPKIPPTSAIASAPPSTPAPFRFVIPGSDLSTPEWAGKRDDEPFDVKAYLEAWRKKHVDAVEQRYLHAMSRFSTDLTAVLPEPLREQQTARAKPIADLTMELAPGDEPDDSAWDESKAKALLVLIKPTLQEIDAIQRNPECVFSVNYQMQQVLPHLQAARLLARMGRLEARTLNPATEFDAFKLSLNRSFRLSRDVSHRGFILPYVFVTLIDAGPFFAIHENLNRPLFSADQCGQLAEMIRLQEVAEADAVIEASRGEYLMCGNTLWGLQNGEFTAEEIDLGKIEPEVERAIDYDAEWASLNEIFAYVLGEYVRTPYFTVVKDQPYHAKLNAMKETARETRTATLLKTGKLPGGSIAIMMAPALDRLWDAMARNEFRLRATRALLLVRRYELRHRRLPESLDAAFQDAKAGPVPRDPYLDSPLKYRVVDDSVKVYSVGKDQQDDRAEQSWKNGTQPGDFILEIPVLKP